MVNWMIGNAALLGTLKVKGLHVLSTHKLKYLEVKQVLSLFFFLQLYISTSRSTQQILQIRQQLHKYLVTAYKGKGRLHNIRTYGAHMSLV